MTDCSGVLFTVDPRIIVQNAYFRSGMNRGGDGGRPLLNLKRWFHFLKLATVLALETSASITLYGGQFTLSTQLIKPFYPVIPSLMEGVL